MKKRWFGYAVWLLLAACLYFFENSAGTRVILLCSVIFPLIPFLRALFFSRDETGKEDAPEQQTVRSFVLRETDEPGDVRPYVPGDPVRRIHWKLTAKKDEVLVREKAAEQEAVSEEAPAAGSLPGGEKKKTLKYSVWLCVGLILLCAALLLLIPEARLGALTLCNKVFSASEETNAYVYEYFPVPDGQSTLFASILAAVIILSIIVLMILLHSRGMALGIMAVCTLFQVYFGLPFPAWINLPLYGLLALFLLKRPFQKKSLLTFCASVLLIFLFVFLFFPGVDAPTEAASETVRDWLSEVAQQFTGTLSELPDGETETRHAHTLSLKTGENEARTGREYRLVTVEEEQISMPNWVDWVKIILLLLLSAALVILPFTPFLLLNARKKKAQEVRKAFAAENVSEAVCAVFQQVIVWLSETGHGAGNALYQDWADTLPSAVPEGYADRFRACALDYEEAAYSFHDLPEEKRQRALDLLTETETALWKTADWKQRLRIRYWMCLRE